MCMAFHQLNPLALRHQVDTVVEGIGINRVRCSFIERYLRLRLIPHQITQNFAMGLDIIDDAYRLAHTVRRTHASR